MQRVLPGPARRAAPTDGVDMNFGWFKRKSDAALHNADGLSMKTVREQLTSETCGPFIRDALERFPELESEQAQALVHDVVEQFFYEVMDVGASESYHHAAAWGLAQHSLETAAYALRLARSRHFVGHAAPNPEEQEYRLPRLRYACFLFALYHDVGKLLQACVLGPDRNVHNPFVESLGAFYDRHGREQCQIQWREGRGVEGHAELTPYLVGHLLPKTAALYLGSRILAEVIEEKTPSAREVHEIVAEADHHSVRHERRRAEAKAAMAGPGYASGSFVAYLAKAFAEGSRQSKLVVNVFGGDVLVGRRFAFFAYPDAILKLVSVIKECFGATDAGARMLGEDEGGARFLLAKLKTDEGVFIDQATGRWKLRATIRLGGESDVREGVLIPLSHLGLATGAAEAFSGSIAFQRLSDGSEVAVDDFTTVPMPGGAPMPVSPAPVPQPKPIQLVPSRIEAPPPTPAPKKVEALPVPSVSLPATKEPAPLFASRVVPATLGPVEGIDPEDLVRNLVEGILAGWVPTNVPQGQVYVSPKTTYVATPVVFLKMREQGLYPDFDPQDRRSAYLISLARLGYVRKSPTNRIVYPILLGPESERPLKVIKFDTLSLFKSQEVCDRVGLWKDWERIIELPQGWKPGDAVAPQEGSND